MGRWLSQIRKRTESTLTKLTKPSSVSFVSATPSHFCNEGLIQPVQKIKPNIQVESHSKKVLSVLSVPTLHVFKELKCGLTPVLVTTCKCGYNPPFCSCGSIPISGLVTCDRCEHFQPDQMGAGIGRCDLGIQWTQELNGRMPLYRYAVRHCEQFSKWMD